MKGWVAEPMMVMVTRRSVTLMLDTKAHAAAALGMHMLRSASSELTRSSRGPE
jgi:hypothetical protein